MHLTHNMYRNELLFIMIIILAFQEEPLELKNIT